MPKDRSDCHVLAMDLGSSSTRTALFDQRGRRLSQTEAAAAYAITYTTDGGAELSPLTLRRAAVRCLSSTLKSHQRRRRRPPVTALAVSSFWHGLLGVDRQWKPVTPIYTWADARAKNEARRLRKNLSEREVHARTGCMLHSSFWPAKLIWLRRNHAELFRRTAFWVSPIDWIFHEIFGTCVSSASMASGTGLYNFRRCAWDAEVCAACHVHPRQLPMIRDHATAALWPNGLLSGARIFTAIGDGAAGNLGSGADAPGIAAINVGTSAAVRIIQLHRRSVPLGLFRYVIDDKRCVAGGAVSNAGNLRQWALRELRIGNDAQARGRILSRKAAAHDELVALPFWAGERAPTWPDQQLGVIDGLNQATKATDLLRVLSTSVFYRLAQILDLMARAEGPPGRIIVSGGILRSPAAVPLLADAIGRDVEAAREQEASLRGAAIYALQQLGFTVPRPPAGRLIRHDRRLAASHRQRRARQAELEKLLARRTADLSS
jgi:gluconokinase